HAARDPGVGDRDVDAAERGPDLRDHAIDGLTIAHVGLHGQRAPAERLHLARRPLGSLTIAPVVDRDIRALAGELEDDPASDPAPAAGDQRDPTVESTHLRRPIASRGARPCVSRRGTHDSGGSPLEPGYTPT